MARNKRNKRTNIDKTFSNQEYIKPEMYSADGIRFNYQKMITKILEDMSDSCSNRSDLEDKWESDRKQRFGILDTKIEPWKNCSNMHVPLTEVHFDTYHANIYTSFFSNYDIADIRPVSADDIMTADKRKQFINWGLNNEVVIQGSADKIVDISLTYGTVVVRTDYVKDTIKQKIKQVTETLDESGNIIQNETMVEKETVLYDAPRVGVSNIDDIFVSSSATGLQRKENEFIIERMRITKSEYYDLVKNSGYEKIDFKKYQSDDKYTAQTRRTIDIQYDEMQGLNRWTADDKNNVTLLGWYGTFYNEDKESYDEMVVIVHPSSRSICKAFINDTGRRPFVKFTPFPIPNRFYGRSLPEKIRFIQKQLNTVYNQRNDSATKRIMQPGFYRSGSSFNPQKYTLEPNGMYPVDNINDVYFPNFQDSPMSSYREEEMLWRYAEQVTGASESIQGILAKSDKTATEIAQVSEKGSIRFDLIYSRYMFSFIELIEQIIQLYQENMPEEKEYRVVGSDGRFKWIPITKQEMSGKLDLVLSCSSVLNDRAKMTKASMIYDKAITNPLIASDPAALYENTKYYFTTVGGRDINLNRQLPKPPQASVRTPEEEHELMYQGKPVEPDIREDAQKHLITHDAERNQPEFKQQILPIIQALFDTHIERTKQLVAAQNVMKQQGQFGNIGASPIQAGKNMPAPAIGQGGIK